MGAFGSAASSPWSDGKTTVFNLGTQEHWKTGASLPSITTAVRGMVQAASERAVARIALPRIGAGFGGLPWEKIRPVLQEAGKATHVELVVFETYVPEISA